MYDKIRKEWGKVFQFDKNSLIINPHAAEVEHLVESLKNIKSFTRTWDKFLNILWQELVKPSCSQDYKVQVTLPNKFNASLKSNANTEASSKQLMLADITSADTDIQNMSALKVEDVFPEGGYFIITKKLNVPYQSGDQLFKNLTELIKTLNAVFCACVKDYYIRFSLFQFDQKIVLKHSLNDNILYYLGSGDEEHLRYFRI